MNWFLIAAGMIASFVIVGHFMVGIKMYLDPMLKASFDPVAKKVMHAVFHYVSVYLIFSAVALLLVGMGYFSTESSKSLMQFIGLNYGFFAVWLIFLAATSGIEKGVLKMFQWIFFTAIATLVWLGV